MRSSCVTLTRRADPAPRTSPARAGVKALRPRRTWMLHRGKEVPCAADEFVQRVAQRTGLDATDAGTGALAVLATIREAVIPGEF